MTTPSSSKRRRIHLINNLGENFPALELGDILEPRGFSLRELRTEREVEIALRAIALARQHFNAHGRAKSPDKQNGK